MLCALRFELKTPFISGNAWFVAVRSQICNIFGHCTRCIYHEYTLVQIQGCDRFFSRPRLGNIIHATNSIP